MWFYVIAEKVTNTTNVIKHLTAASGSCAESLRVWNPAQSVITRLAFQTLDEGCSTENICKVDQLTPHSSSMELIIKPYVSPSRPKRQVHHQERFSLLQQSFYDAGCHFHVIVDGGHLMAEHSSQALPDSRVDISRSSLSPSARPVISKPGFVSSRGIWSTWLSSFLLALITPFW